MLQGWLPTIGAVLIALGLKEALASFIRSFDNKARAAVAATPAKWDDIIVGPFTAGLDVIADHIDSGKTSTAAQALDDLKRQIPGIAAQVAAAALANGAAERAAGVAQGVGQMVTQALKTNKPSP